MKFHFVLLALILILQPALFSQTTKTKTFNVFAGVQRAVYMPRASGYTSVGSFKFDKKYGGIGAVGVDILNHYKNDLKRFFVRVQVEYNPFYFYAKGRDALVTIDTIQYEAKGHYITPSLTLLYNLIQANKFDIYAGGGVGINYADYSRSVTGRNLSGYLYIREDFLDYRDTWVSSEFKVGALYKKKFGLCVYASNGTITKSEDYKIKLTALGVNLNCRF